MIKAEWKLKDLFNADAQKVADEISSLESRTPKTLLEYAKNPDTELHKCYTWNDTEAAEKCRLYESRKILCNLVIAEVKEEKIEPTKLRLFHKTDGAEYKPIQFIVKNKTEYEVLLERAMSELRAFKQKYSMLSELEEILALID